MNKNLLVLITVFSACSAQAATDFLCPSEGISHGLEKTYRAMSAGSIWASGGQPIVFVDERNELKDSSRSSGLTAIGESYVDKTGEVAISGTFKIGYEFNAKECRRQIVLEEEIVPGVWKGHTAIEICNPEVKALFAAVKGKTFDQVWKVIESQAKELEKKAEDLDKETNDENGVCYRNYNSTTKKYDYGKKYNEKECDEANALQEAMNEKARKLQRLELDEETEPLVKYFNDKDGNVLPRFKVDIKELYFRRMGTSVYDSITKTTTLLKYCRMNVKHATSYAGLAEGYSWDFNYQKKMESKTWTYNIKGESDKGKAYKQDPAADINFLDDREYFFLK